MKEKHLIFGADTVSGLLYEIDCRCLENEGYKPVFKRFFLSDFSQMPQFPNEDGAISYLIQPPLDGYVVSVWIYLVADVEKIEYSHGTSRVFDCGLEHIWTSSVISKGHDSFSQTSGILDSYEAFLAGEQLNIASSCVRTWFFCRDIDNNYSGLVRARRENFFLNGLTPETHFIASTGIDGCPVSEGSIVQMDAYAIKGKYPFRFLYAPDHLNPTYEYGVTFERGILVEYSGSAHCLISGTASIDNKGAVLHQGDILAQTCRMLENVEALLVEGGMHWDDVRMALIYIRNASDYPKIAGLVKQKFPNFPSIILKAPVCRPEWLIEMECIAVHPHCINQ